MSRFFDDSDDVLGVTSDDVNNLISSNLNRLSDRELCRLFRLLSCFFCRRAFFL